MLSIALRRHRAPFAASARRVLVVSTSPNFAAKWLVHRLARFADAHPDIDLTVNASRQHIDFAREDIDVAIRHGDKGTSGFACHASVRGRNFPRLQPQVS